jgi:hypothetical protein
LLRERVEELHERLSLARGEESEREDPESDPPGQGQSKRPDEGPVTDTPSVLLSLLSHCRRKYLATCQRLRPLHERVESTRSERCHSHRDGVVREKDVRRLASYDRKLKHLRWMMDELRARIRRAYKRREEEEEEEEEAEEAQAGPSPRPASWSEEDVVLEED